MEKIMWDLKRKRGVQTEEKKKQFVFFQGGVGMGDNYQDYNHERHHKKNTTPW